MELFGLLAQGYQSKPLGEKIGYVAGAVLVLVLVLWAAVVILGRIRRR